MYNVYGNICLKMYIYKFKNLIWKILKKTYRLTREIKDKVLKKSYVRSAYGIKLAPNWNVGAFNMYYHGLYGNDIKNIINTQNEPFYFFDFGAHQGLFGILAAKNSNCKKSYVFEPIPETVNFLKKNIDLNQVNDKVVLYPYAISDLSAEMEVLYDGTSKASLVKKRMENLPKKIMIKTINHVDLDTIKFDSSTNILAKIDTEGLDEIVIEELIKTRFFKNITEIIYEVHEGITHWAPLNYDRIIKTLKKNGFTHFKKIDFSADKIKYDVHAKRNID